MKGGWRAVVTHSGGLTALGGDNANWPFEGETHKEKWWWVCVDVSAKNKWHEGVLCEDLENNDIGFVIDDNHIPQIEGYEKMREKSKIKR